MSIWLRTTQYSGDHSITMVVAPESLTADIHVVANDARRVFGDRVDVEIFEFEGSLEAAVLEAKRRSEVRIPETKRLQDALHDFLITTFIQTKPQTMITPMNETPLSANEIREVLLAVMQHPGYKGQVVGLRSNDRKGLMLENNLIVVKDLI